MPTTPISHVSDTALWVAMYRAMETDRPDAVFRDPYARRLAGERGEAIVQALPRGREFAWPMIVRTAVMDEVILRLVQHDGVDTIVNLASGLDTRAYRLALPPGVRWVDVDLPAMSAYKQAQLAGERAACTLEYAAADLTDRAARRALLARIGASARGGRALVVTEGLLVYLTAEQVADLATDLHAQPAVRWWLIDLASPRLLEMLRRSWGVQLSAGNAPMQFAPAEGTAFFAPLGWREAEFRSTGEEAHRLKREMRHAWLWRFIGRLMPKRRQEEFRRMAGIVLLERTG